MRRRYIGLAKSYDMKVHVIMFPRYDPITHGLRRKKFDGRGYDLHYWIKVAQRHEQLFEKPDKDKEGFDELFFYDFDTQTIYEIKDEETQNIIS